MSNKNSLRLGRGQKAPYQTTHYRIPKPIKPMIERLAEEYKDCVFSGGSEEDCLKKMSHSKEAQEITELKNEIEELQKLVAGERQDFLEAVSDGFKAAKILHEALTLKPNAGGKIKEKIREALQFIDDI